MQDVDMVRIFGDFSPGRLGYSTLVLGESGSGKTHTARLCIEGLAEQFPCCVIDCQVEYGPLARGEDGRIFVVARCWLIELDNLLCWPNGPDGFLRASDPKPCRDRADGSRANTRKLLVRAGAVRGSVSVPELLSALSTTAFLDGAS